MPVISISVSLYRGSGALFNTAVIIVSIYRP